MTATIDDVFRLFQRWETWPARLRVGFFAARDRSQASIPVRFEMEGVVTRHERLPFTVGFNHVGSSMEIYLRECTFQVGLPSTIDSTEPEEMQFIRAWSVKLVLKIFLPAGGTCCVLELDE
jgi:hypothetical protein